MSVPDSRPRLAGKVAVVTGAGRGIGRAVALAFAHEGAAVVVADIGAELDGTGTSAALADEVAAAINAAGGEADASPTDVGDHGAAARLIESAVQRFGRLDILVNAAGNFAPSRIEDADEREWDRTLRVHVKGTFNTTAAAASYWKSAGRGGRLLNFGSDAGFYGYAGSISYATAKAAVTTFTLSCAGALAQFGVTANVVVPQAATRMTDPIPMSERPDADRWSTGEFEPENVTPAVIYLASDAAHWVSGCVVGSFGHEVHLYALPARRRSIYSAGPWDPEVLAARFEQVFRPVVAGGPG